MCIRDSVVTVPDHPQRVLLGEGRFVFAMALLDRADPVARVVGWQGEMCIRDRTYIMSYPIPGRGHDATAFTSHQWTQA